MQSDTSRLKSFACLPTEERKALLERTAARAGITTDELRVALLGDWRIVGRDKQQPPPGGWTYWFLRCGRGFGKTLTAAQWTRNKMREFPGCRVALVAPTLGDGRDTQVEGVSGMLAVTPESELRGGMRGTGWNRSLLELYYANGSQAKVFGSDAGDRLRGPEHDFVWAEEVSSWKDAHLGNAADTTWSNAVLGARGGINPQFCITSTPKPNKLTKYLMSIGAPSLVMVTGSSYENRDNLPQSWWDAVVAPLEGTRTGRQEILAELLDDIEGALWSRAQLEALRVAEAPELKRIVVAVDPNATGGEAANSAGIVVVGVGRQDGHGYVLADRTVGGGPYEWSRAVVAAYDEFDADVIVAEKNNGGDMVKITIEAANATAPVKLVTASKGKRVRAEPIAMLYDGNETNPERPTPGRVHHVGKQFLLEDLEEQMCLPGWTLIETARGQVPIRDVTSEDRVMTRDGFAPLVWSGQTGFAVELIEVVYPDGCVLSTRCHPVFLNREFAPATSVRPGHLLDVSPRWGSTAHLSLGAAGGGTGCRRGISVTRRGSYSIERSGNLTSARSRPRRDCMSITATKTLGTTSWRTSNSSRQPNTSLVIPRGGSRSGRPSVTSRSLRHPGWEGNRRFVSVSTAGRSSHPSVSGRRSAVVAVNELVLPEPLAVYNLTVAEGFAPEFYANGVLVHNCTWTPDAESPDRMDALVWALTELMIGRKTGAATILNPNGAMGGVVQGGIIQGLQRGGVNYDPFGV